MATRKTKRKAARLGPSVTLGKEDAETAFALIQTIHSNPVLLSAISKAGHARIDHLFATMDARIPHTRDVRLFRAT